MRALVAVCLLAVAAADQTASASAGAPPAAGRTYQAAPVRLPAGAGRPAAPADPRAGYRVSPGGFKTPVGVGGIQPEYQYQPSPYAFDYAVNNYDSGAQYSANENSDGKQTTGFYKVALPDGRIQTVKYTVDDFGGFNAEVSYEGEARYPEPSEYNVPVHAGYKSGPSVGYKPVAKAPVTYKAPTYNAPPIYKTNKAPEVTFAQAAPPAK
ncbi:cuticle protein 7-like [Amphibalanus amphitrite]|uniref:cuticle protein 7-like n=1 Tax=Amphibalanus amphitrite TaxID=1232801 RepID=UPI001C92222D|nr:cuticle protein 7-like [Amphibalanus amphitrite]